MKSRRGFAIQRLMNAMRQSHADGWFIVFDTLTLADDRLEAFYDNPNALRDYFRDIGRMVLAAEGRKANDSHADCYQYLCVPEYGTANGRLHFHAVRSEERRVGNECRPRGVRRQGPGRWGPDAARSTRCLSMRCLAIEREACR